MGDAPVLLVPCITGRLDNMPSMMTASQWGSLHPAIWSFCLAARARGLGTSWTSLHLMFEEEAAGVLGIPFAEISQGALIPVAYTKGTDFKPGPAPISTRSSTSTAGRWTTRCAPPPRRREGSCHRTRASRCTTRPATTVDGPYLEIGSYCGKSAIYLGAAARARDTVLFSVDHHRGSEENQPGWEYHEPDLVDPAVGVIDTLPFFRRTIHDAGLEGTVIATVADSPTLARYWSTPLAVLFIDGGHGAEPAHRDYELWTPHVAPGGTLLIHDVFPEPRRRRTSAVRDLLPSARVRALQGRVRGVWEFHTMRGSVPPVPEGAQVNQEEWDRFYEQFAHARVRRVVRFVSRLPSAPRCEACGSPYSGIGGALMRVAGKGPSRKNPRWCRMCFEMAPEGGSTLTIGVLFADVRGSTALAERTSPKDMAAIMNRFYSDVTKVVVQHGVVDKLIGDEVMGLYFPPLTADGRYVDAMVSDARQLLRAVGYGTPGGPPPPRG